MIWCDLFVNQTEQRRFIDVRWFYDRRDFFSRYGQGNIIEDVAIVTRKIDIAYID